MIGDPRVGFVAFTGSVEGGHAVQRAAAERFIGTGLELGGKDPAYVRADADARPDGREPRRRLVLQLRPVVLRRRAHLRRPRRVRRVRRRLRRAHRDVRARRSARSGDHARPDGARRRRRRSCAAQIDEAVAQGRQALDRPGATSPPTQPGTPYLAPQVLVDVDHVDAGDDARRRSARSSASWPSTATTRRSR